MSARSGARSALPSKRSRSTGPDFSDYLAHFTRDGEPHGSEDPANPVNEFAKLSAGERLVSILESGIVRQSTMPWTGRLAACFTECPWSSLLDHAKQYSPYGVGFSKRHVFAADGGPVYYVRADQYEKQQWAKHLHTFVTPFWPAYRAAKLKDKKYPGGKTVDYSHEREWRVPHDFTFKLPQVEFVILPGYHEMAAFPGELKDAIGREKFLLMEVYKTVEHLWPVHNIG